MAEQVGRSLRGKIALAGLFAGGGVAVAGAVDDFQPDVVHAHWWFPGGIAAAFGAGDRPFVVTMHGSDVRLAAQSRFAPAVFRHVVGRAAAVTAVSSWLARTAEDLAPGLQVAVAPMPVDVSLFAPGPHPRERSLLFVGRLNAQKGVADLLRALSMVSSDIALDVIGDGPDRAILDNLARSLGVAERVRWHGHLPQVRIAPFYSNASAVVIPSREEGLGLVAVEALLSETPVVAYRSGGLVDLVDDRMTGLLVDEGNVAQLTAAITSVLASPVEAATMGLTGRRRMLGRFSPATAAATYLALYRAAIAR